MKSQQGEVRRLLDATSSNIKYIHIHNYQRLIIIVFVVVKSAFDDDSLLRKLGQVEIAFIISTLSDIVTNWLVTVWYFLNIMRGRQDNRHFPEDISKIIS